MLGLSPFALLPAACALAVVGVFAGVRWLRRQHLREAARESERVRALNAETVAEVRQRRPRTDEPLSFERMQ